MAEPNEADLPAALRAIREAAEAVRAYDTGLVERVETAIAQHGGAIRRAANLAPEAETRRQRIAGQLAAVGEAIAHARQYPEQIMARAAVLDRIGALARLIRESPALLARD